jgi:DNA-binding MltR family transcriptional regulator
MRFKWKGTIYHFGRKAKAAYMERMAERSRNISKVVSKPIANDSPIDLKKEFEDLLAVSQPEATDSPFADGLHARDRIIRVTSYLAELLRYCITLKMAFSRGELPSRTAMDSIFEGTGTLSSFADRIRFCSTFGLLPDLMKGDIGILKEIRNEVAHSFGRVDFDDPWIAKRCADLTLKMALDRKSYKTEAELKFMNSSMFVMFVLYHICGHLIEQKKVMNEFSEITHHRALVRLNASFRKMGWPENPLPPEPSLGKSF